MSAESPENLSVSHATVGSTHFKFNITTKGVVVRRLPQGQHKYDMQTNFIAINEDPAGQYVTFRREGKVTPDAWHFFSSEMEARQFILKN
jgi:hypothetical protein